MQPRHHGDGRERWKPGRKQREKETYRHTERQTDRQTETEKLGGDDFANAVLRSIIFFFLNCEQLNGLVQLTYVRQVHD